MFSVMQSASRQAVLEREVALHGRRFSWGEVTEPRRTRLAIMLFAVFLLLVPVIDGVCCGLESYTLSRPS